MVSPDSRTMLTAALKPPIGMAFDVAVATTYTLDPALALTLPVLLSQVTEHKDVTEEDCAILRLQRLRSHAEAITIFVQEGSIKVPRVLKPSPAYSLLDAMICEVTSPKGGVFHPKIVLVRYKGENAPRRLRLVVMTRNLTFDKSWDVAVILDGAVKADLKTTKNDGLARFVQSLANENGLSEKRRAAINSLRLDLSHVEFEPPEGYRRYAFHLPLDNGIDWIPRQKVERWGMISPFLTKEAMSELSRDLPTPEFVLSRDEELAKVGGTDRARVLRDVGEWSDGEDHAKPLEAVGLHAKCYLYDYTYEGRPYTRLVIGSGNATSAALVSKSPRNVEFMVSLSGPRIANGVCDFARAMESYWMPWTAEDRTEVDEEAETAKRKIEDCKRRLLEIGFLVECDSCDDGLVALTLRTRFGRKVEPFDGVKEIRAFPVTQLASSAIALSVPGNQWGLQRVRAESVTGLIAFEIISTREGLSDSFVLNLQVRGMPPDRDEQVLASVLANRSAFLRFLSMLLEDGMGGSGYGGAEPFVPIASMLRSSLYGGLPLADCLLRAYCRTPGVLTEIARAVAAADKAGRNVIPDDFRELWASFSSLAEEAK